MAAKKSNTQPIRITDAKGRQWNVYEFSIHAGKTQHFAVGSGSGAYRGFEPVDGGARRRRMMWPGEAAIPAVEQWLLEQLQLSNLDPRDNPELSGRTPQRVDKPTGNEK